MEDTCRSRDPPKSGVNTHVAFVGVLKGLRTIVLERHQNGTGKEGVDNRYRRYPGELEKIDVAVKEGVVVELAQGGTFCARRHHVRGR